MLRQMRSVGSVPDLGVTVIGAVLRFPAARWRTYAAFMHAEYRPPRYSPAPRVAVGTVAFNEPVCLMPSHRIVAAVGVDAPDCDMSELAETGPGDR